MRISANRDANRARKAKVGQFKGAVLVDEQILRLQVSVKDATGVTKGQSTEQLKEVTLIKREESNFKNPIFQLRSYSNVVGSESIGNILDRIHVLFQIQVQVFKNKVKLLGLVINMKKP